MFASNNGLHINSHINIGPRAGVVIAAADREMPPPPFDFF